MRNWKFISGLCCINQGNPKCNGRVSNVYSKKLENVHQENSPEPECCGG